ncbi:hypothetical protein DOS86_00510 [Anaplasma marginale]|nr:hypothetical protein DOS86_00510 [Anaplasma marginale]
MLCVVLPCPVVRGAVWEVCRVGGVIRKEMWLGLSLRVWYAVFVCRSALLGQHRRRCVLPTVLAWLRHAVDKAYLLS